MGYPGLIVLAVVVGCVVGVPYLMFRIPLARLRGLLDDGRGDLRAFSGTLTGQYRNHHVKFLLRTGSPRGPGKSALFTIHVMFFGAMESQQKLAHVSVNCLHRDALTNFKKPKGGPVYAVTGNTWVTQWAAAPDVRQVLDDLFLRLSARELFIELKMCELDWRGLFGHPPEEVKKILEGLLVLEESLARAAQSANFQA